MFRMAKHFSVERLAQMKPDYVFFLVDRPKGR